VRGKHRLRMSENRVEERRIFEPAREERKRFCRKLIPVLHVMLLKL
jgi:hypothetical protein